ncbi:MAG: hypothetical protein IPP50_22305 [Piscinibacter sp.]|nr:hypothetical protein [Piscinibacter sp.]
MHLINESALATQRRGQQNNGQRISSCYAQRDGFDEAVLTSRCTTSGKHQRGTGIYTQAFAADGSAAPARTRPGHPGGRAAHACA